MQSEMDFRWRLRTPNQRQNSLHTELRWMSHVLKILHFLHVEYFLQHYLMSLLWCLLVDTLLTDPMYYLPFYLLQSKHPIALIMFNISQAF